MRSPSEIGFRLRQEAHNLRLFLSPPGWGEPLTGPLPGLPDPEAVAESVRTASHGAAYREQIQVLADELLTHRFRLLGLAPVDFGDTIPWRRDFLHGQETGLEYFRQIPYLDFHRVGDHKLIWELNRHQHLVLLAQAFLLTGRLELLEEIRQQLDHWMAENPVQRGINWTSALEVAFRALSWVWVLHLVGKHFPEDFRRRWMRSLHHHGLHLEHNLSVYFSPNTHLLGEAVALAALGRLLPQMPRAANWLKLGTETVWEQMRRQVREDGSHFEQSSYYHVYAVDFFLLHNVLNPETPEWYKDKLKTMVVFLEALVSSQGLLPLLGDEDGGRLFHPYGDRRRFAVATLVSCARWFPQQEWMRAQDTAADLEQSVWWMNAESAGPVAKSPARRSRWFADAGLAILRSGQAHIVFDAGPFGGGSAGHSHADTLSIVAFLDGEELLIDPGTFTYLSDPLAREQFRGTAAHNTVSIDSLEQATPQGPFRWKEPPEVELVQWNSMDGHSTVDIVDARCRYRGITHRRSLIFQRPNILIVVDRVDGLEGMHRVEQRWLMPAGTTVGTTGRFLDTYPPGYSEPAEYSQAMGSRQAALRRVAQYTGKLPTYIVALIRFDEAEAKITGCEQTEQGDITVTFEGGTVCFPDTGAPFVSTVGEGS